MRIEIQKKTKTQDASGATAYGWVSLMKLWADVRHNTGTESIKADALIAVVRASVRIRYRAGIDSGMRVLLADGSVYEIKAVLPDVNRRVYVDLICERAG